MKSKIVLFSAITVMVSLFTSCRLVPKQALNNPIIIEAKAQETEKIISTESESIGYEIIRKVSENRDSNTKIFYPEISEYKGELLMDYVNQSLRRIVDIYGKGEMYHNVTIDYKITKMDKDIISVLFKGVGKISGEREINIQKSVNLDIKTSNTLEFDNLIKADKTSKDEVKEILRKKAEAKGIKIAEAMEGINIYFQGENIVLFYMRPDDSSTNFEEISVSRKEIENLLNTRFGERPAS